VSANSSSNQQISSRTVGKVGRASRGRNPERSSRDVGGLRGRQANGVIARMDMRPAPQWCPSGISKTQRRRLQKLR
jgi:hypothetical protein